MIENYVYKKEVDWSLLQEGLTLPLEHQVVFAYNMGRFLKKGESKKITLIFDGKSYVASVRNVNFNPKWKRKKDTFQIRYPKNGKLSQALQAYFNSSFNYIKNIREIRPQSDRSIIRLPDDLKEYLAIYTTEEAEDVFLLEAIVSEEVTYFTDITKKQSELVLEHSLNYDEEDKTSSIIINERITKIRKLNKKIGDNLKLLYGYRCQICGDLIGEDYGTHIAEAHHIDYFTRSLNNNSDNLLVLCPNHHRLIHNIDPIFDRKKLIYKYPNGYEEGLLLNKHLKIGN